MTRRSSRRAWAEPSWRGRFERSRRGGGGVFVIRDIFTEFARARSESALLRNVRGGGSRGDATIRASGPHSHARSLPPAVMFSTRVASLGVLAAAALLASASVASAECAPFCTRVPADRSPASSAAKRATRRRASPTTRRSRRAKTTTMDAATDGAAGCRPARARRAALLGVPRRERRRRRGLPRVVQLRSQERAHRRPAVQPMRLSAQGPTDEGKTIRASSTGRTSATNRGPPVATSPSRNRAEAPSPDADASAPFVRGR